MQNAGLGTRMSQSRVSQVQRFAYYWLALHARHGQGPSTFLSKFAAPMVIVIAQYRRWSARCAMSVKIYTSLLLPKSDVMRFNNFHAEYLGLAEKSKFNAA